MTIISFAKKIAESQKATIYEVYAKDAKGFDAYYFIKVPSLKERAFNTAMKEGNFNLKDFGIIISSGYGTEAPFYVRENVINGNLTYEGN